MCVTRVTRVTMERATGSKDQSDQDKVRTVVRLHVEFIAKKIGHTDS